MSEKYRVYLNIFHYKWKYLRYLSQKWGYLHELRSDFLLKISINRHKSDYKFKNIVIFACRKENNIQS